MCLDTFSIKIQVMNVFQCIQPAYANSINNEFNLSSVYNARNRLYTRAHSYARVTNNKSIRTREIERETKYEILTLLNSNVPLKPP